MQYTKDRLAAEGLSFGEYTVEFYQEHKEDILAQRFPPKIEDSSVDWDAFRREAAKGALNAIVNSSSGDGIFPDPEEVCGMAVLYADELIGQLKKEQKCQI